MHIKGYMLQQLASRGEMWDHEIANDVMRAYNLSGEYWNGTVRLTLADLHSSGLLNEVEKTVDPDKSFGEEKLLFKYTLTQFGRERMRDSGLLEAAR